MLGATANGSDSRTSEGLFVLRGCSLLFRDGNLRDPAELLAQLERPGDPAQRLQGRARADDRNVAVVKDAAHQALVNVQTLHLVEVHLDRVARYESALHDNAPVG